MQLTAKLTDQILARLSHRGSTVLASFDTLISAGKVPTDLRWQPSLCLSRGEETILVHILAAPDLPAYLERAVHELSSYPNISVLILARDLILEASGDSPPSRLQAAYAAAAVAERALALGCGLAFEAKRAVHLVFDSRYTVPLPCRSKKETGHIPKWLYKTLSESEKFSPRLQRLFKRFAANYKQATRHNSIPNEREAQLLLNFARSFAKLDERFFLPIEGLETLRNFEMSRATRARDHFFHTFNNLFLGFHILGQLSGGRKIMAEVDKFIEEKATLNPWEVLWFLTCLSHDPGYTAEKFWANFRFTFGIVDDATYEPDMPDQVKEQITDVWDSKFAAPRQDLGDLYNRTVRKWIPPSIAKKGADHFDAALRKAYFDGKVASHSLISGLRLINSCHSQNVPRSRKFNAEAALTACVVAALCMIFHDPRCRATLLASGIPPIAFESLPYACTLMYVDCLQDDRRDISKSRFPAHGVLASVTVRPQIPRVDAEVCLREVPVKGWPGRIAEYESVVRWINTKSNTRFVIDYRSRAELPR